MWGEQCAGTVDIAKHIQDTDEHIKDTDIHTRCGGDSALEECGYLDQKKNTYRCGGDSALEEWISGLVRQL